MPAPDRDAGSLFVVNCIRVFQSLGYAVTFMPDDLAHDQTYTPALEALGVECVHAPAVDSSEAYLRACGRAFDVAFVCRPDIMERHGALVRSLCPHATVFYETVDLHYLREERRAVLENSPKRHHAAAELKARELGLARQADCALVVSPYERDILAKEDPRIRVEVLPIPHEVYGSRQGFDARRGLLFIGGFRHPPNVDGVRYFVREILPRIASRLDDVRLYVLGSEPPKEVRALASDRVVVTGHVRDISGHAGTCRVSVAPLRYGAGVKGKILTSLAWGLPVVATPQACEGMGLEPGRDVLEAATPHEFADAVVRLHSDGALWARLSANGLALMQRQHSLAAVTERVRRLFADVRRREDRPQP